MIRLTIDKKAVKAKKGETVLEVAQRQGIYIPTLCYRKDLTTYGGCRLCIVEVKGWKSPVTSCTLPVENGMVVKTNTAQLRRLRRFSMQLLLSEHPHACLICDKKEDCADYQECIQKTAITSGCKFCSSNGDCELQELVEYLKVEEIPFDFSYRNLEVEKYDPFFERDYNLCVLCGRCVRVCQEIREAGTLDFHHRGPETLVGTAFNLPHLEAGCQFCGACVDVCPTGALRERHSKWEGLPQKSIRSTCLLCNIGCSINLNVNKNKLVNATPSNNQVCVRGRFGISPLVYSPKRITQPLLRKDNRLVQVEWGEALAYAATKLDACRGKTGILFTPQITVKAIDSLYSLADYLRCIVSSPFELDVYPKPVSIKKIKDGAVILIVNTDMVSDFSPLLLNARLYSNAKPKIIVIDALKSRSAETADLWLQPAPGKEIDILKVLFTKAGASKSSGVSPQDIALCKDLLKNRNVYLVYNSGNMKGINLPRSVNVIRLSSYINTLKIYEMGMDISLESILKDRTIDCLYTIGVAPKLNKDYKTIIVQDSFPPPFEFDLFLPAATFAEINGSVINIEGKARRLHKAIEPLGGSKPDDWIIKQIGELLKYDVGHRKPKRRKRIKTSVSRNVRVSKKYPLHLIVRENCYLYRGHLLSALMRGFERLRNDSHVWINSRTAKRLKIKDGADVKVVGKNLNLKLPARITDSLPQDSVLIYSHPSMGVSGDQAVRIIIGGANKDEDRQRGVNKSE